MPDHLQTRFVEVEVPSGDGCFLCHDCSNDGVAGRFVIADNLTIVPLSLVLLILITNRMARCVQADDHGSRHS